MSTITRPGDLPDWLLDAVPGAREALAKIETLVAEGEPLSIAVREARNAMTGKYRVVGKEGHGIRVPAVGVSQAEFDAINAEILRTEEESAAHGRTVKAARDYFDSLIAAARRSGELRVPAARAALAAHAEAVDAWAVVERALAARDDAYRWAGSPGTPWHGRHYVNESQGTSAETQARKVVGQRVSSFDVGATEAAANGEEVDRVITPAGTYIRPVRRSR